MTHKDIKPGMVIHTVTVRERQEFFAILKKKGWYEEWMAKMPEDHCYHIEEIETYGGKKIDITHQSLFNMQAFGYEVIEFSKIAETSQ